MPLDESRPLHQGRTLPNFPHKAYLARIEAWLLKRQADNSYADNLPNSGYPLQLNSRSVLGEPSQDCMSATEQRLVVLLARSMLSLYSADQAILVVVMDAK